MKEYDMLPCRYCGGVAKIFRHPYSERWFYPACPEGRHALPNKPEYYPSRKKAAQAWNDFMSTEQMELTKEVPNA